ncbi:hypothetical protein Tco_0719270 [Tanacetum coccineum]
MIACVEKTAQNADFYQIIDYLTGCSINYSLLVDPDLIGPWLQQFWTTASLRVINDVPHIRAMVAGKKILISEETIRADLLFDDANGVDCFPKQVLWDSLRDIGYEGNLAQLTFSKPLFSPQWKYLVHVLLHCLSPKSTSWEQFGTNIASALVGLATNQKFNFSLMIMNGMLGHISNGTPFLMYPRFIQLFLNKQLEGVARPQDFIPSVTLPSKVFTFMRKHSPKFSCRITPLTPPMLEVVTALAAEEAHSESTHSRAETTPRDAQGTPSQSAAQASISTAQGTADTQGTAQAQGTDEVQGKLRSSRSKLFSSQNKILQADAKLRNVSKFVQPVGQNIHALWAKHYVHDDYTLIFRFEDVVDKDAAVTPDLERKSDETEEINVEEKEASNVKSGDTEELDLETFQKLRLDRILEPEKNSSKLMKKQFLVISLELQEVSASRALRLQMMRRLQKIQAEWDAKIERKRAFDTLWEILHILDRQDLQHLYRVVQSYYEHIPPTGLGLILLGDLTTIWDTPETSDDDFWKNQEDWEIIRWRLNESSGVHTLELEDGTMIHMLAERRYPLSRELMIRMLDHGMEVE